MAARASSCQPALPPPGRLRPPFPAAGGASDSVAGSIVSVACVPATRVSGAIASAVAVPLSTFAAP